MPELIRLLVIVVVLLTLGYLVNAAQFQVPIRVACWAILLIIALVALLPFLGIHVV